MGTSSEKLVPIPVVYLTFMESLWPVLIPPGPQMLVSGIPFSQIYWRLHELHGYDTAQVRSLADNLVKAGLVREDKLGFFSPTEEGKRFLESARDSVTGAVPAFPG